MSFTAARRVAGGVSITLHQLAKGVECSRDQVTEIQVNLLSQQGQYVAIPQPATGGHRGADFGEYPAAMAARVALPETT